VSETVSKGSTLHREGAGQERERKVGQGGCESTVSRGSAAQEGAGQGERRKGTQDSRDNSNFVRRKDCMPLHATCAPKGLHAKEQARREEEGDTAAEITAGTLCANTGLDTRRTHQKLGRCFALPSLE